MRRNSHGLIPASFYLLMSDEQEEVQALMVEYNGTSLDEIFRNPETFYNQVLRGPRPLSFTWVVH